MVSGVRRMSEGRRRLSRTSSRTSSRTAYLLEHGWVDDRLCSDVTVVVEDGRFVTVGGPPVPGAERLPGVTLPGFADVHSRVLDRALGPWTGAGREERWATLVDRLDPDGYRELATAVFRVLVAGGTTSVGEMHLLHHQAGGVPYDEPNATGLALVEAARDAGVRIALLDTCFLADGFGRPVSGVARRFSDGTAEEWQQRADELTADAGGDVVVGAAVESVEHVPLDDMRLVAEWADRFETPLHVRLSASRSENDACSEVYGRTPTELLSEAGVLTDRTTAVHASYLVGSDLVRLGAASCTICLCPGSERERGAAAASAEELRGCGARPVLGTAGGVLAVREQLGQLDGPVADRVRAATADGHAALGFTDAGRIAVGHRADLVSFDLGDAPSTESALVGAPGAEVVQVVVGGRVRHRAGEGPEAARALDRVLERWVP